MAGSGLDGKAFDRCPNRLQSERTQWNGQDKWRSEPIGAELPADPKALQRITLGELVRRYRDSVSPRKKTGLLKESYSTRFSDPPRSASGQLSELCTEDFATYRDERLKDIKPTSLKRELVPIRHMFEVAKHEWGLPIRENPIDKLKLKAP